LVFAGVRRLVDAEALRAEATSELECVLLDVAEAESRHAALAHIERAVGAQGLYGLVNNAGVSLGGPIECLDLDVLRRQFEVNVFSVVAMVQAFAPLLRLGRGRIVNVSSMGGFVSAPFQGAYCASKFALEAVSDSLRQELGPLHVEVSLIQPGSIATQIWSKGTEVARQDIERYSSETKALYGDAAVRYLRAAQSTAARAVSPDVVAAQVARALTSKRPRTRYVAGPDARLVKALRWILPDRAMDRLVQLGVSAAARSASRGSGPSGPREVAPLRRSRSWGVRARGGG
jgi:NAD(P)-dependent dehydrogenase (short-subunit alcohol dehydrogenase family)